MPRKHNDPESRARDAHHRSIDRLEAAINDEAPYDGGREARIAAAMRREKRARSAHDGIVAERGSGGRQDEAEGRD